MYIYIYIFKLYILKIWQKRNYNRTMQFKYNILSIKMAETQKPASYQMKQNKEVLQVERFSLTFWIMPRMAMRFPASPPTKTSSCCTVCVAEFLAPTCTCTTLSRCSMHHCSTSCAKVALNKARRTWRPSHAW